MTDLLSVAPVTFQAQVSDDNPAGSTVCKELLIVKRAAYNDHISVDSVE